MCLQEAVTTSKGSISSLPGCSPCCHNDEVDARAVVHAPAPGSFSSAVADAL
jgi:hypothetical protein